MKKATFAAGCFWSVEETFRCTNGVVSTTVGYTGGNIPNPSYEKVCSGITGHTEAVEIEYEPSVISYQDLLNIFWNIHNPTVEHKTQYKSAIFFHDQEQKQEAENSKEQLRSSQKYKGIIITEILPASKFYSAEEYHQEYLKKIRRAKC